MQASREQTIIELLKSKLALLIAPETVYLTSFIENECVRTTTSNLNSQDAAQHRYLRGLVLPAAMAQS